MSTNPPRVDILPRAVHLAIEGLGKSAVLDTISTCLKEADWDRLVTLKVDPRTYSNAYDYWRDSQAVAFFSKNPDLPTKHNRREAAVINWWKGERSCYQTNVRLRALAREVFLNPAESRARCLLGIARKAISHWVGTTPPSQVEGRFGPGSTYSDRSAVATIPHKISSTPTLTSGVMWHLPNFFSTVWGKNVASSGRDLEFVQGNRFTTVPKDAMKDRAIAAEPSLNIFYQLAYGQALRSRLRKSTGLDLSHLASRHRQVACAASKDGLHATIDLSNASDSVCIELVRLLLPRAWFDVLYDLRSPKTFIDGKWVVLEKFSSMGNGYTFELETIIFLSLAYATLKITRPHKGPDFLRDLTVFGDDIIVPSSSANDVIGVLKYFGMETNQSKTFTEGNFRESCGGDFFCGQAVRPYYMKALPREPQEWISFANGLRRSAMQFKGLSDLGCLHRAWLSCLDALPNHIRRCRGPERLGDIVVHDQEERWDRRSRDQIRYVRVYRPAEHRKVLFKDFDPDTVLACALYGTGNRDGGVTPRNSVIGYKVGWVPA